MENVKNLRFKDITSAEALNVGDERIIRVTYLDGTSADIPYSADVLLRLKKMAIIVNEREKELANTKAVVEAEKEAEEEIKENTVVKEAEEEENENTVEGVVVTDTNKESGAWKTVLAVAVGAVLGVAMLKGCSKEEEKAVVTEPVAETSVNEDVVTAPATDRLTDGIDVTIDYEQAINDIEAMDKSIADTFKKDNYDVKLDQESTTALYVWLNLDNMEPAAIEQLQQEDRIPDNGTDLATASFKAIDNIGHVNTEYMYGFVEEKVALSDFVVDPDEATYVQTFDGILDEMRDLSIKVENGEITAAEKARAQEIYDDIFHYMRSEKSSVLGNRNNHNEGIVKMEDMININSILQAGGRARFYTQEQILAITGKHIDPATGEKINNTAINEWAQVINEYNHICESFSYTTTGSVLTR